MKKVAALAVALLLAPRLAAASKADAFENKIQPVSGHLMLKSSRFELTPTANLSLNDAFFNKYLFGVKGTYHLGEQTFLSAQVVGGFSSPTGSAVVCPAGKGCATASSEQLYQVPGNIKLMGGAEFGWAPIYGKLNMLGEKVLHFDGYVVAGVDYISYQDVLAKADAQSAAKAGSAPGSVGSVGGHVGLGMRIFMNEFAAVRLEMKDYIYAVSIGNLKDINGSPISDVQNQLFAELGVSFFFPLHFSTANE